MWSLGCTLGDVAPDQLLPRRQQSATMIVSSALVSLVKIAIEGKVLTLLKRLSFDGGPA